MTPLVPYWRTDLGSLELEKIATSLGAGHLSQGAVTEEFEAKLGEILGVPYVVATTSGTMALFMAFSALGISDGDEVLLPNRTFVATANAVLMTGAKVKLIDTLEDSSLLDTSLLEAAIGPKTRAIVPVHLNGNTVEMQRVREVAARHRLWVVEDAAQAFYSKNEAGFLGTQSDIGCFSLGVTKFITTGQGGFTVTRNRDLFDRLQRFRSHGVLSTFSARYDRFGFNCRFNDILASLGLAQVQRIARKYEAHLRLYHSYVTALSEIPYLELLPASVHQGAVPLWIEVLSHDRDGLIAALLAEGIQCRPFLPDLSESKYLENDDRMFPHSKRFAAGGLFLPSGPDLPTEHFERTIRALRKLGPSFGSSVPQKSHVKRIL